MEDKNNFIKILEAVTKYIIYALVFLVPVFFLPWTAEILDFNKQALLVFLVFIAFFAWMAKVLISGELKIIKNWAHASLLVLFLVYLASSIFSVFRQSSIWGWPQITSESLLTITGFCLLYFLITSVFSKKEVFESAIILTFSVLAAQAIGIFQLLGWFILPFDFAKNASFNTIGSVGSLGIFSAALLAFAICAVFAVSGWKRAAFILQIILSAFVIILINFPVVWQVVLFGSVLVMILGVIKRKIFDARWMALPVFFIAVSLFFVIFNPQTNLFSQRPNEIFLSHSGSFQIVLQTLKENLFLGSGPGTFNYDFSKFKNPELNNTPLWNITFNSATSKILNRLAETGVLGVIAFLFFSFAAIFLAVKFFVSKKFDEDYISENSDLLFDCVMMMAFLSAFTALLFSYFLYNSNFTLDFIYFFMLGCLMTLAVKDKKTYTLNPASFFTLVVTSIFTVFFIFGIGVLILGVQRYIAEINYSQGISFWQAGDKDSGLKKIEKAASLNPASDLYFRQISQIYLLLLQDEITNPSADLTKEQLAENLQILVANSINSAKIATDINPNSVNNWAVRGYVYHSLLGLVLDAADWAEKSYDQAILLDPNNSYLFVQKGNVLFAKASAQDDPLQKNQFLINAESQLKKAVSLNANYANALYSLGLVYDGLGQKAKALEQFNKVASLNPDNLDIKKIIENLKSGRKALQDASVVIEPPSGGLSDSQVELPLAE